MGLLTGKIAWITGAGSGIGQAGAIALSAAGAVVVVSGRRASALAETARLVREAGGVADCFAVDVADKEMVQHAAQDILARHRAIDILVNSAGLNIPKRYFGDLTAKDWDQVLGINLNGALYCTLAALPAMREKKDGLVINISSWWGRHPGWLGGPAYNASKAAMATLTHQLNLEEGLNGIRGCVVYPGEVATPLLKNRPRPPAAEDVARMLLPEDVGRVIRFVAESPARVCLNEIVVSPAWNRLILGGAEISLTPLRD